MTPRSPARVAPRLDEDATPEEYAEAMVRCEGYPPACSDQNECAHDGDCFRSSGQLRYAAARKIMALIRHEESKSIKHFLGVALDALMGKQDDDF